MFIFLFAPVFAWLWTTLAVRSAWNRRRRSSSASASPWQVRASAHWYSAPRNPGSAGLVSGYWMILAYLLHTCGELCLSPVGLSAVTKLAVPRVVGVMMGAWFLATAYSEFVAAQLAKLAAVDTHGGEVADVATALAGYSELYTNLLWTGLAVGALMLLLSPLLRRMMHGIH
jgi:POT family proton-dependent oligopeptide transporter